MGFCGEGGGGVAVDGRIAMMPVLGVDWAIGIGVISDAMAWST